MAEQQLVMYEEEFVQIQVVVDRLLRDAMAKVVMLVDMNGQLIAQSGETDHLDVVGLAVLTAGNVAATGGIARILRENGFTIQFHEGEKANIYTFLVANRLILEVVFDARTSPGLVRLRLKKAGEALAVILEALSRKQNQPGFDLHFADITDEDIDNLFND